MCNLFSNINWVNYGWELFNYVSEARKASLGNATVAYNFDSPSSSLGNPCFPLNNTRKISLTHQSRFAGIVNNELASFQLKKEERLININLILKVSIIYLIQDLLFLTGAMMVNMELRYWESQTE